MLLLPMNMFLTDDDAHVISDTIHAFYRS
jgi:hypothetical protein